MPEINFIMKAGIYALMAVCVLGALLAVTLKNLFHAALALTGVLLGIAGIYIALHADFLAMAQVLIYVGAVMTLIIFAIMLTERFGDPSVAQNNRQTWAALGGGILLLTFLTRMIQSTPWPVKTPAVLAATPAVTTLKIGEALLGQYVFPFEVISVILIAALLGAIVVARKDEHA